MHEDVVGKVRSSAVAAMVLGGALLPATASAFEANSWVVRGGATTVAPDVSSDQLKLNGSKQAFINAVGPAELDVDNDTQLGLTVEYMFTSNWGLEILAATPFKHTAKGTDSLSGLDVAEVKHLLHGVLQRKPHQPGQCGI